VRVVGLDRFGRLRPVSSRTITTPSCARKLGFFANGYPKDIGTAQSFESWLGQTLGYTTQYVNATTWWKLAKAADDATRNYRPGGPGARLVPVIAVDLVPYKRGHHVAPDGSTMGAAAAGWYDKVYGQILDRMVANGVGVNGRMVILRPGPEMTGDWFPWNVRGEGRSDANAANYVAAFRRFVALARARMTNVRFDFSIAVGQPPDNSARDLVAAAYPGDDVVDYIGGDVYDNHANDSDPPSERWAADVRGSSAKVDTGAGLSFLADFAAEHGKPISIAEFGLWPSPAQMPAQARQHGGGDDPYWMAQMCGWIRSHNVAYANLFDGSPNRAIDVSPNGEPGVESKFFPRAMDAYKQDCLAR
jgi:Glycosyl hydrolase family 26